MTRGTDLNCYFSLSLHGVKVFIPGAAHASRDGGAQRSGLPASYRGLQDEQSKGLAHSGCVFLYNAEGLLFLEWIAERAEAEFLLKTDDDATCLHSPSAEALELRSTSGLCLCSGSSGTLKSGLDLINTLCKMNETRRSEYPSGVPRSQRRQLERRIPAQHLGSKLAAKTHVRGAFGGS